VLNHIFEVKRFIARGGMGEVFEGVNVNSDERVAIKVMLPSLAADPNVQAMFRKEARTLTRLTHPALVQYRVLAQEPNLGIFYIVTEYVDGQNLSDVLRDMNATPQELLALTRRLAEGLNTAHSLGAIHRDMSPDNIMLEGGKLSGAKIIDFGIAKDLDPGSATIVGDGFAGKLNYVAPEQLGDFNREVGAWTDIYSLGLVILAIASKKDVNMGGTLVDAVDKRRAGPDLSAVPAELQPVLERMLKANPADRFRSMGEVIEFLSANGGSKRKGRYEPTPVVKPKAAPKPAPLKTATDSSGSVKNKGKLPLIGGGVAAVLLVGGAIAYFASGDSAPAPEAGQGVAEPVKQTAIPAPADPVAASREALRTGLASVGCTWLDVADATSGEAGLTVALRGVAGKPAEAQALIGKLLEAKGIRGANIDFNDVSPIEATECGALDGFRQIKSNTNIRMTATQRQFEMGTLSGGEYSGQLGAKAVLQFDLSPPVQDVSLYGVEPNGTISFIADKAALSTAVQYQPKRYRVELDINHKGWSGLLLLIGDQPVPQNLVNGVAGARGPDWSGKFLAEAQKRGTKAEMVWFQTVDKVPN
jgi:serine/threonine-protein kinase